MCSWRPDPPCDQSSVGPTRDERMDHGIDANARVALRPGAPRPRESTARGLPALAARTTTMATVRAAQCIPLNCWCLAKSPHSERGPSWKRKTTYPRGLTSPRVSGPQRCHHWTRRSTDRHARDASRRTIGAALGGAPAVTRQGRWRTGPTCLARVPARNQPRHWNRE